MSAKDKLLYQAAQRAKKFEGFSATRYKCPSDDWSIGYGHNLERNAGSELFLENDGTITEANAEALLYKDLEWGYERLKKHGYFNSLSDARKVALLDMVYNMGLKSYNGFKKMRIAIENDNWQAAHDEVLNSTYAQQVAYRARDNAKLLLYGDFELAGDDI